MGMTISSKRYSCDMSYSGFARFRTTVARCVTDEVGKHYQKLMDSFVMDSWGEDRDAYFEAYDARTHELVEKGELPAEIANFLYQSDSEGKIDRKQAKMIAHLIKDCEDDIVFGYAGSSDCARMSDMKRIFSDNTKVEWY